jgi:hypothetical protein
MILRIAPSETECNAGEFGKETLASASRSFRLDGALIIENIVEGTIIAEARRALKQSYHQYLDGSEQEDAARVGDRRLMVTITLEPPFDDPQLFANPYLPPVLNAELDDGFVIGAFGAVFSLPPAARQHCHYDGGILFPRSGFDSLLPAPAITVGIPLIEMNQTHGTTALWLGSHRDANSVASKEAVEPVVREGSCMLWDFRLFHAGTANPGTVPRPLLYLTYCRPWFMDHLNFNTKENPEQTPLVVNKNVLSGLSGQYKRLLARAHAG